MTTARTILLVDDAEGARITLAALLEDRGHRVIEAATLAEARACIGGTEPDLAVIDLHLPDGLGTELFAELRARHPSIAIVLLSGSLAHEAPTCADLVLEKGIDPELLTDQLEAAIQVRKG